MAQAQATEQKWNLPKIIFASSAGTLVEWYDFYIFGSLSTTIASKFYSTGTPIGDMIAWLATFAIGFIVRPFGAIVFGRIGDLIGRKYTFLVTMTLMGVCTFLVGLLPTRDVIGDLAGIILITLRILQGLALGGEYGGAAPTSPNIPRTASAVTIPRSFRRPPPSVCSRRSLLSWAPGLG